MFKLTGCLLAFILLPILFLFFLVIGTLARFFGFGGKPFMSGQSQAGGRTYTYTSQSEQQNRQQEPRAQQTQAKQDKIIPKNEGEYVDFEEVK